jgi:hypothetical protein
MSLNHSPAIVTDGLVLCLDAANIRSYPRTGTTWSDLVGANNGTMENMTSANYSSDNGGSLIFDGSDDHINFGTPSLISSFPLTITAFIRRSNSGSRGVIFGNYHASSTNRSFQFEVDNNDVLYAICSSSGNYESANDVRGSTTININEIYHVACVMESGEARVYLNGRLDGTDSSWASTLRSPVARYLIGGQDTSTGSILNFNGDIHGLQLYNKALTADEIRRNYEATVGRYT